MCTACWRSGMTTSGKANGRGRGGFEPFENGGGPGNEVAEDGRMVVEKTVGRKIQTKT